MRPFVANRHETKHTKIALTAIAPILSMMKACSKGYFSCLHGKGDPMIYDDITGGDLDDTTMLS